MIKIRIRNPFYITHVKKPTVMVRCAHCSHIITLAYKDLRSQNYCWDCR
jgi:hypothetical protein